MTGSKVYSQALGLLGYAENNGNAQLTQRVTNSAVPLLNLVYNDLRCICGLTEQRIESLSQEITLPEKALDICICGLASYIAQTENDDSAQAFWSAEYQSRRTILSRISEIKDVLPTPEN